MKKYLIGLLFIILLSLTVSAARMPAINSDNGTWGTVLNDFLNVTLNDSGELEPNTVSNLNIIDNIIMDADISDITNLTLGEKITFTLGESIDNIFNSWISITGRLNVTEDIQVKNITIRDNNICNETACFTLQELNASSDSSVNQSTQFDINQSTSFDINQSSKFEINQTTQFDINQSTSFDINQSSKRI